MQTANTDIEEFLDFDADRVKSALVEIQKTNTDTTQNTNTAMFTSALEQGEAYNSAVENSDNLEIFMQPVELRDKMNIFRINDEYLDDVKDLQLPQFFIKIPESLFVDGGLTLLTQNGGRFYFTACAYPYIAWG